MASKRRYVLSGRVLIVGEPVEPASTLSVLCQLYGAEVRTIEAAADALQAAEEFRPDIVLANASMPARTTQELPRQIRARSCRKDALFIALVEANSRKEIANATSAGFDAHLVKPVEIDALVGLIAELRSRA